MAYRGGAEKSSSRGTESSGAVLPLSANAAAAVAAAVGHASLSRRGEAASSSAAARAAVRGGEGSRAPAAAATDAVESGDREGRPGARAFEEILATSGSSSSKLRPLTSAAAPGLRTFSARLSDATAATDTTTAPTAAANWYAAAAAAPAAHASRAAGKGGSSSAHNGVQAEPIHTVDLLGRRVWDKSYYEARAQSKAEDEDYLDFLPAPRQKKVAPPVEHRRPLQRRDFSVDLTKELGRSKIVTLQTPRMQQGGFWCDVCECLIKDSAAYLDHVNGRNHNRMLGMTMRVERAPPERVIGKLRELERQAQLELEGEDYLDNTAGGSVPAVDGAAAEKGAAAASSSVYAKVETASGTAGGAGAPAAAGKVRRPLPEENYDDIDRIKRRLEELQKQEEERKLKRKLKKKRKKAESATAEDEENAQHVNEKQGMIKEEEQDETEEQKMLKAMGLPSGFVGS